MAATEWDEFAQTRDADDLFDDEIVPISAEQQQQEQQQLQQQWHGYEGKDDRHDKKEEREVNNERQAEPPSAKDHSSRSHGQSSSDRKWRGSSGDRNGGRVSQTPGGSDARFDWASESENKTEKWDWAQQLQDSWGGGGRSKGNEQPAQDENAHESEHDQPARRPAVRGDRSATGGIRKVCLLLIVGTWTLLINNVSLQPKLSEDELSMRMEAAKRNASKIAAIHARAKADQASFLQREKVEEEKGHRESQNSEAMNDEREMNRQRKLEALKDRGADSWDVGKHEGGGDSFNGGGSRFGRRPRNGGEWGDSGRRRDREYGSVSRGGGGSRGEFFKSSPK